jgi:hypothetical protein
MSISSRKSVGQKAQVPSRRVLPRIGETGYGNLKGGHTMMKKFLQGFILLLVVMSTSTAHWEGIADFPAEYRNKEESMSSQSAQNIEIDEWVAMKKLDFVIGHWQGEGWLLLGPDQRYPFSVTESYNYRCNGLVVDGEGRFRPQGSQGDPETQTMYGLGMIYFDRPSGEYRMWHYGGTGSGIVFTQKVEIDVERRTLHYINIDARGETYKFGFAIDDEGILTARSERQKPDGTWYVSMEFRMRRVN